jgi:hypothetical protein
MPCSISVDPVSCSLKCEEVYLNEFATVREAGLSIGYYIRFYDFKCVHQALRYDTRYRFCAGTRSRPDPDNPLPSVYSSTLKKYLFFS